MVDLTLTITVSYGYIGCEAQQIKSCIIPLFAGVVFVDASCI